MRRLIVILRTVDTFKKLSVDQVGLSILIFKSTAASSDNDEQQRRPACRTFCKLTPNPSRAGP